MILPHALPKALPILPLAFSYDPAVVVAAISQYATFFHGPYLFPQMFGGFTVDALPCVTQTSDLFVDTVLSELCVAGFCLTSMPFLDPLRIIPIMGLDAPTELVSPFSWIKNSFPIFVEKIISVLLAHPSASAV